MDKNILFFEDISTAQFALVGGKGVNLGIMKNAGFPVPNGFCVTSGVYRDFITQNDLHAFLDGNTDGADIRASMQASARPEYLEREVADALARFDDGTYFSVRSSATAEDLPFASFAGQQDTYLNVTGLLGILDAIRNCWASLYTDRAIAYRQKQNIDSAEVCMAVVVQKMVMSEKSGILFTADPVSENRQVISIDAGFGLGEALVSGIISPDIYKYDKLKGQIADKLIANKKLAIYPLPGGGTEKRTLEDALATSQVLDDETIQKLAKLGQKMEDFYQSPQDIEWCIERGELFLVQSRAITSLFPPIEPTPDDGKLHSYVSFGHMQMMLAPISPAGIDLLRMFFRFDDLPFERYKPSFIKQAAGRIFIDLSWILQNKLLRKPFSRIVSNVDLLASQSLLALLARDDFNGRIAGKKGMFGKLFGMIHTIPPRTIKKLLFGGTEGSVQKIDGFVWDTIHALSEGIESADNLHDKLRTIYSNINLFRHIIQNLGPYLLPGLVAMKRLEKLERELLGINQYSGEVIKGLAGNVTTEMGLLVGDLADYVRSSEALRQAFSSKNYSSFFARIDALPGEAAFKGALESFMQKYGVRAAGEIDIATERWIENPEPFVNAVLSMVDGMTEGEHRMEFAETRKEALAAAAEFICTVSKKHGRAKGKKAAKYIKVVRDCLPVREHPKFMMMHLFYCAKKALLTEADQLVAEGRLEQRQDIFMLGLWELDRAAANGGNLKPLVAQRKAEYDRFCATTPPRVLTSDGEIVKASYGKKDLPADAIVGVGVSSGIVEGIAKVIHDPTDANIEKGEILVAPYTDPGWTTLFINASGLVTEVGGLLTHGTVVAREYGIPAVVGCENATNLIKTGQRIRLDGSNGFVTILEA